MSRKIRVKPLLPSPLLPSLTPVCGQFISCLLAFLLWCALLYCNVASGTNPSRELGMVVKSLEEAIPSVSRKQVSQTGNEGNTLLQSIEQLREETSKMKEEVASLLPLRKIAVGIRERFFAYYRRKEKLGRIGVRLTIERGNKMAHDGDVVTDVCLFESGQMAYRIFSCFTVFCQAGAWSLKWALKFPQPAQ